MLLGGAPTATGAKRFCEPQPRSKLHVAVDVGTIDVRIPLETMVDAVWVIVKLALIVVGIKTVVEVPVEVEVEVEITGVVWGIVVAVGFTMEVKVPLETTVVAV